MVRAEPMQAHVHAFNYPPGGKIKVVQIVTTELRAQCIASAGHVAQGDAQQYFAHAASVKGRGVNEVEAAIEGNAHAAESFIERDGTEFLAERRRTEAENGNRQTGFAKWTRFHR